MGTEGPGRAKGLALACWVPLVSLVAVEIYARGFEGWGAWAAAPLFLLPLLLSLVIGGAGAVQCWSEIRAGSLRPSTVVSTGVAALPLAWLLVRRHLVSA
jgi:hypothetical protein